MRPVARARGSLRQHYGLPSGNRPYCHTTPRTNANTILPARRRRRLRPSSFEMHRMHRTDLASKNSIQPAVAATAACLFGRPVLLVSATTLRIDLSARALVHAKDVRACGLYIRVITGFTTNPHTLSVRPFVRSIVYPTRVPCLPACERNTLPVSVRPYLDTSTITSLARLACRNKAQIKYLSYFEISIHSRKRAGAFNCVRIYIPGTQRVRLARALWTNTRAKMRTTEELRLSAVSQKERDVQARERAFCETRELFDLRNGRQARARAFVHNVRYTLYVYGHSSSL